MADTVPTTTQDRAQSTRSRLGCLTCRGRRKRCSEEWDANDSCSRCTKGGFQCTGRPPPPAPPPEKRKSRAKDPSLARGAEPTSRASSRGGNGRPRRSSRSISPLNTRQATPPLFLPNQAGSATPEHEALALSVAGLSCDLSGGQPFVSPSLQPAAFSPSFDQFIPSSYQFSPPPHSPNGLASFLDVSTISYGPEVSAPGTVFTSVNSSSAFASSYLPPSSSRAFLTAIDHPRPTSSSKSEYSVDSPAARLTGDSLRDLIDLYPAANEPFWSFAPHALQPQIVAFMTGLGRRSESCRMASLGWITIFHARSQPEGSPLRAQLVQQSTDFIARAVSMYDVGSRSLDEQLVTLMEIYFWKLLQDGPSGCYGALHLCELTLQRRHTPPTIDLRTLYDVSALPMVGYVYPEVFRSIIFERQTLRLVGLPGYGERQQEDQTDDTPSWGFLGVPLRILSVLAAVSRLATDEKEGMEWSEVKRRAALIEADLKGWSPRRLEPMEDSMDQVRTVATQEMWKHASTIYLYQAIHHVGCLSEVLQSALAQILALGRVAERPNASEEPFVSSTGSRVFPWFLASTVATTRADQEACRRGLEGCGMAEGVKQNGVVAELLWDEMRVTGNCPEWRQFVRRPGQQIILF